MPLLECSVPGGNRPVVGIRKRLLESDVHAALPGGPFVAQRAISLARSATNLLEASDNPPVAPFKRLCTELPTEAGIRRQAAITKREKRYTEWIDMRNRGVIFDGGLSYLETRPVQPGTHNEYMLRVQHLNTFVLREGLRWTLLLADMDLAIMMYLHFRFFAGYDHGDATKLLAAISHVHPHVRAAGKEGLPRSNRCAKGWRKEIPPKSRVAPAWPLVCILAVLCETIEESMGLATLIANDAYLRPGELLGLRVKDLVPPSAVAADIFPAWSVVVRPEEVGIPTKVGTFDDTVRLDKEETREFFIALLPRLIANRDPDEFLWKFSSQKLVTTWRAANDILLLPNPFHVYSLRHAGPSHDAAARLRSLLEIQHRGRWKTRQSLQRYEKHGRMQAEFEALSSPQKAAAVLCRKFHLECFLAPNAAPLHLKDLERAGTALRVVRQGRASTGK